MRNSFRLCLFSTACLLIVTTGCSWTPFSQSSGNGLWSRLSPARLWDRSDKPGKDLDNPGRLFLAYAKWQEQVGQLVEARESYEVALNKDPKSVDAILGLARLDHMAGRHREAESGFQKAAKLKPNDAHVLASLGQFYAAQNRWGDSVQSLKAATLAAPNEQTYRYYLAAAMARFGDIQGAYPEFVRSVGESAAHYNIGYVLYEKNLHAAAEQEFVKALAIQPNLTAARDMLREVRQQSGKNVMLTEASTPQQPQRNNRTVTTRQTETSWPVQPVVRRPAVPPPAAEQQQYRQHFAARESAPATPQNPFAVQQRTQPTQPPQSGGYGYGSQQIPPTAQPGQPVSPNQPDQPSRRAAQPQANQQVQWNQPPGWSQPDRPTPQTQPAQPTQPSRQSHSVPVRWNSVGESPSYPAMGQYRIPVGEPQQQQSALNDPFARTGGAVNTQNTGSYSPQQLEQLRNQMNAR